MDEYQFICARQRYWKEVIKSDLPDIQVASEEDTVIETNFIVHEPGSDVIGVFEDDGETGYLYLYSAREQTVLRYLHIYDRSETVVVSACDVRVVRSQDRQKCGVKIWGKMRGIIDLFSDKQGRVWLENRNTPGIDDAEWLTGF